MSSDLPWVDSIQPNRNNAAQQSPSPPHTPPSSPTGTPQQSSTPPPPLTSTPDQVNLSHEAAQMTG